MRFSITLFVFILFGSLYAQDSVYVILNTDHYQNGDLHWRGYDSCEVFKEEKFTRCNSFGLWEYWHENGIKMMETIQDSSGYRFTNMWSPDGTQILKNSHGFIYDIHYLGRGNKDSCIYEVKNGEKNGNYRCYRNRKSGYYIVGSGEYMNGKKHGLCVFDDPEIHYHNQTIYANGERNGSYKAYYTTGVLKAEGQYLEDEKTGRWKYYDNQANLLFDIGYLKFSLLGPYMEYYPGGGIKVRGMYTHISGKQKVYVEDLATGRIRREKYQSKTIVARDGEWKYYNPDGSLRRTKHYKKKKEKKYPERLLDLEQY